ncbi:hypothetical protein QAD02_013430, partial [Eretmocerus hayati]
MRLSLGLILCIFTISPFMVEYHEDVLRNGFEEVISEAYAEAWNQNNDRDLIDCFYETLIIEQNDEDLHGFFLEAITDETEHMLMREKSYRLRITRIFLRDISNPFETDSESFRRYYRLTPRAAIELIELLAPMLLLTKGTKFPIHLQVLLAVRFLAEGMYQKCLGQDFNHPASQPVVSRIINRVIDAIVTLKDKFIIFPSTSEERLAIQAKFQRTIRVTGILGLVDGFIVRFLRPSQFEEAYFNYKEATSMNVQL